ncbi:MAG: cyclic nucleotide-binding domain-containing protein [Bdellovibrionales bacterium]|nr:cyclic nucleotide-binding domain-containing protein [Bdellovibrionales bacterium]
MEICGFGFSDKGNHRESNQDCFLADNELGLYVVCDGMGGRAGGQTASKLAVEAVRDFVQAKREEIVRSLDHSNDRIGAQNLVRTAVNHACQTVFAEAEKNPELKGMGTTLTMLVVGSTTGVLAHVGDSRAYVIRSGVVHQLSKDHTVVQEMIDKGILPLETAAESPFSHILSRAVGTQPLTQVDTLAIDILQDDAFLLCSDGLTQVFDVGKELGEFIQDLPAENLPQSLVNTANERDTSDNSTALLVSTQVSTEHAAIEAERRSEVLLRIEALQGIFLFRDLSLEELSRVVNRAYVTTLPAGEALFREGELDDSLYIVLEGELNIKRGKNKLATIRRGNHVGEMAMLMSTPRSATVTAAKDCRLLNIERKDFEAIIQANPTTGVRLLTAMSRELSSRLDAAVSKLLEDESHSSYD